MRIYKADGTYTETHDSEFGWSMADMIVTENNSPEEEVIRKASRKVSSQPRLKELQKEEAFRETFLESVSIPEPEKPVVIKHVNVNVKTEPIANVIDCRMEIEGLRNKQRLEKQMSNLNFTAPSKEELAKLINPCNIETRALMSIIYFAKYKSLIKEETSAELFKSVNFKTTNYKCLIKDRQDSLQKEIKRDLEYYQANKEDNMLSLMMELILTDLGCNLEDIVDLDESGSDHEVAKANFDTSDLGNSIQSSFCSRELSSCRSNYRSFSDRGSVLSSIGLDDEDKNLQSFCEETLEMRLQTANIKESFQEEENRVNELIKMTTALKEEVRETLYLDDILHLLKGDLEKVKMKKLPFKIFYKEPIEGLELNLIV